MILVLGTPRAKSNGPCFALGWVVGLVVVTTIALVVTNGAADPTGSAATGVNWTQVVIGVLLLGLAGRRWRSRPKPGEAVEMPKWMAGIDTFTVGKSLGLGLVLSVVNPKNLALVFAAMATISGSGVTGGDRVIAAAVFVVLGSVTVAGAVGYYLVFTERATSGLAKLEDFMARNNSVIMMVILLIFGIKLIGSGVAGVST